jgi:hypothetical protein
MTCPVVPTTRTQTTTLIDTAASPIVHSTFSGPGGDDQGKQARPRNCRIRTPDPGTIAQTYAARAGITFTALRSQCGLSCGRQTPPPDSPRSRRYDGRQQAHDALRGNIRQSLGCAGGHDALEQLHKDRVIGSFDAAVIDKQNGKPHVAKRLDRPEVRIIPEWFGGGTLPRKELREAAEELTADQAGLIAVGEPTIEKAVDRALTGAAKVVKHTMDATTDEISSELQEALKG